MARIVVTEREALDAHKSLHPDVRNTWALAWEVAVLTVAARKGLRMKPYFVPTRERIQVPWNCVQQGDTYTFEQADA